MKRRSVSDDLTDGFTPSPLPPLGPDGSLMFIDPPHGSAARLAPRLCEQGPCINYHRLEQQLDAETPRDGSEGGLHIQVHHSCYPQSGIEFDLGVTPIVTCSLWMPTSPALAKKAAAERARHLKTKTGKKFLADMAAWQKVRAEEARLAEEAAFDDAASDVDPSMELPPPDAADSEPFGGGS